ncbi:hypothetical protein Tco_0438878, partial [Tanacetum coccineum]
MNCGAGGDKVGGGGAGGAGAGGVRAGGVGADGAGPAAPKITRCIYVTFMKCDPQPFKGTEGAVGLCLWFEKLEFVFRISDCKERDKVKFATATLQGRVLTWWNGRIASMGIDVANGTPWTEVRKWMTEEFCRRSVLQRLEQELYNMKLKGTNIDGQGGNNGGAIYKLGAVDALQDPKVVTGTFLLNNRYAIALFVSGANKSFVSTNFSTLIDIELVELDTCYDVELADGKLVKLGSFDIIIGMDWLSRYDAAILCGEKKV